jgi:hypothetical protein
MYLYYLTVTNFGNLVALIKVPWVLAVAITFHAAGGALVQVKPSIDMSVWVCSS